MNSTDLKNRWYWLKTKRLREGWLLALNVCFSIKIGDFFDLREPGWGLLKPYRLCPLFLVCGPITTKLGMMVLWDKISHNPQKVCWRHHQEVSMTSSSRFWYRSRSEFEFPYLLSDGAEIWHVGQFWGTDFEFEPKIRYNYVSKEKKAIIYEKLKFLLKHSLTKVLLWQHPRLLLTQNYSKWCLV